MPPSGIQCQSVNSSLASSEASDTTIGTKIDRKLQKELRDRLYNTESKKIPKPVEWNEIQLGDLMSRDDRESFIETYRVKYSGAAYALKRLSGDLDTQSRDSYQTVWTFMHEMELLQALPSNPHLPQIHGVRGGNLAEALDGNDHFVLTDIVEQTLDDYLDDCLANTPMFGKNKPSSSSAVLERLEKVGLGVAEALKVLHSRNVVLGDLQTSNVGFTTNDVVQIFSLRRARCLLARSDGPGETPASVPPRYMAPEMFRGEYGTAVDVYAFGLLLWEVCTLQRPFHQLLTSDQFYHAVSVQGKRPSIGSVSVKGVRPLIESCWAQKEFHRPTMEEAHAQLMAIINEAKAAKEQKRQSGGFRLATGTGHSFRRDRASNSTIPEDFSVKDNEIEKDDVLIETAMTKLKNTREPESIKSRSSTRPSRGFSSGKATASGRRSTSKSQASQIDTLDELLLGPDRSVSPKQTSPKWTSPKRRDNAAARSSSDEAINQDKKSRGRGSRRGLFGRSISSKS